MLLIITAGNYNDKLDYFVRQALQLGGVRDATVSSSVVGDDSGLGYGIPVNRTSQTPEFGLLSNGGVDHNFITFYGIKLIAGRNFKSNIGADANSALISKKASQRLGFSDPNDALGRPLAIARNFDKVVTIIGVYDDYQFGHSLLSLDANPGAKPSSILLHRLHGIAETRPRRISLRVDMTTFSKSMADVQRQFTSNFPHDGFRWRLLDDNINRHYDNEMVSRNQLMLLTVISVCIACLGLLGMDPRVLLSGQRRSAFEKY